jgi:hypothetical protein
MFGLFKSRGLQIIQVQDLFHLTSSTSLKILFPRPTVELKIGQLYNGPKLISLGPLKLYCSAGMLSFSACFSSWWIRTLFLKPDYYFTGPPIDLLRRKHFKFYIEVGRNLISRPIYLLNRPNLIIIGSFIFLMGRNLI